MKKSSKIILLVIAVIAVGAIVYRAVNTAPPASMQADARVMKIMDNGAQNFHSMPIGLLSVPSLQKISWMATRLLILPQ